MQVGNASLLEAESAIVSGMFSAMVCDGLRGIPFVRDFWRQFFFISLILLAILSVGGLKSSGFFILLTYL